jgi:hypothetical protein
MKIEDNTHWEQTPCIWVEEREFQIDIQKDEVEIVCDWDHGYGGRGTERMVISRQKLLELLSKMDEL